MNPPGISPANVNPIMTRDLPPPAYMPVGPTMAAGPTTAPQPMQMQPMQPMQPMPMQPMQPMPMQPMGVAAPAAGYDPNQQMMMMHMMMQSQNQQAALNAAMMANATKAAPVINNNNNNNAGGGGGTTVVIAGGVGAVGYRPVNHCCHCMLFVATAGAWLPCWIAACFGCCCQNPCG